MGRNCACDVYGLNETKKVETKVVVSLFGMTATQTLAQAGG